MNHIRLFEDWKQHVYTPDRHLGYPRENMPQIEDDQQINFFKYLDDLGIKHKKTSIKIKDIIPAQKEMRLDVAQQLLQKNSPKLKKPLIVSKDKYLMDGHHRWLALWLDNKNQSIDVILVDEKGVELLEIMKNFGEVKFKTMEANKIQLNEAGKFPITDIVYDLLPSSSFFSKNSTGGLSKEGFKKWEKVVDDLMKTLNDFYRKNNIPWQYYKSNVKPKLAVDTDNEWEDDDYT